MNDVLGRYLGLVTKNNNKGIKELAGHQAILHFYTLEAHIFHLEEEKW